MVPPGMSVLLPWTWPEALSIVKVESNESTGARVTVIPDPTSTLMLRGPILTVPSSWNVPAYGPEAVPSILKSTVPPFVSSHDPPVMVAGVYDVRKVSVIGGASAAATDGSAKQAAAAAAAA